MRKLLPLIPLLSLFGACSVKPSPATGDWMPLRLNPDSTMLYLEDYFMDASLIKSVKTPEGLTANIDSSGKQLWLKGNPERDISLLKMIVPGYELSLVVKKSLKVKARLEYPDPKKAHQIIFVAGDFNGWTPSSDSMYFDPTKGSWILEKYLNPGEHSYRLHFDDLEQLDGKNPEQKENGLGGVNSVWSAGEMEKAAQIRLQFDGKTIFSASTERPEDWIVLYNNQVILEKDSSNRINLTSDEVFGDGLLHIYAGNQEALVPVKKGHFVIDGFEMTRQDRHRMIMYFVMLDRFFNGKPDNDPRPLDSVIYRAQFLGGDINGLGAWLADGYFEDLNVNSICISPISSNPKGAWGLWDRGGMRTRFSAYHGYWPISFSGIDPRFGSELDLRELIRLAHREDKNIILDFVAHHVHIEHPLYKDHPDWVTPIHLPDGSLNTERWDEFRFTTWVDAFLPTLDMSRPEVCDATTDSAMYWFHTFDLDGLHHDATQYVPNKYWRMLTRKMRTEVGRTGEKSIFQIGESHGSAELIDSYLGSGLMDAQIDFNLYDAALRCFAFDKSAKENASSYENLARTLRESIRNYGPHHLMGNISGNKDKPRFVSLADGSVRPDEDTRLAGYSRKIRHRNSKAFRQLAMMMAFNYMIPGIPVVYYGDEIGMPGANDPDNRRMMRFDSLSPDELKLRSTVSELGKIRSSSMALMYGSTEVENYRNYLCVQRKYGNETILAYWSKSGAEVPLPEGSKWELISGNGHIESGRAIIDPLSYIILKQN
ncbi:MAG: alpha-amylase [Bacteroidetes bacterium]|nr:alpha-amylase [Bacteroidota bacterium]